MSRVDALSTVTATRAALDAAGYVADEGLATAVHLAITMRRPLLLEGEPGVGKTAVAKTLASILSSELIRLQCYEGIDAGQALYEWQYPRQLLALRRAVDRSAESGIDDLYTEEFLAERPLLRAIRAGADGLLLIDELDRADDAFEAFLLEALSDFTISIPELGTVRAETPPVVIVTSNRTRELHDALKRRCLYHWIGHPSVEREVEIIMRNAPEVGPSLARSVAKAVEGLRSLGLQKPPGPAEAIDWARAVQLLADETLDTPTAQATLGWVIKNRDDQELVAARGTDLFA